MQKPLAFPNNLCSKLLSANAGYAPTLIHIFLVTHLLPLLRAAPSCGSGYCSVMEKNLYIVPPEETGIRLDRAVAAIPSVASRSKAKKAIESGKVTVDGAPAREMSVGTSLTAGTRVEIRWNTPGTSKAWVKGRQQIKEAQLDILFEDESMLAVSKPPGLLTDSASRYQQKHRQTLKKRLKAYLNAQNKHPFIVHRIDRDTSGVVLIAKTEGSSDALRIQFRDHTTTRIYWLAVHGTPRHPDIDWVDPMMWDSAQRIQRIVPPEHEAAYMARCTAKVLHTFRHTAILEVQPDSGRRNQIRLQAHVRDHPLIGERLYVPENWEPPFSFPRQALHARHLTVKHPKTGQPISFDAPLPDDLQTLEKQMRHHS